MTIRVLVTVTSHVITVGIRKCPPTSIYSVFLLPSTSTSATHVIHVLYLMEGLKPSFLKGNGCLDWMVVVSIDLNARAW